MAWDPLPADEGAEPAPLMHAPDAINESLVADKVDEVILIRVDEIQSGDRLRSVDPVWAQALGQVMAREGQRTPVEVCRLPGEKLWTLVDGAHRLTAAKMKGMAYLRAIVVSANREDRRLREISALLWTRGLTDPIDRAAVMAELVSLKRAAAGLPTAEHRTASVATRWKKELSVEAEETVETISNVYGFSEELGEQLGLTGRTVRNDLMLYRRLVPSLVAKLREARHPLAKNATQLRALAKLDPAEQQKVVWTLLNSPTPKGVADALALVRGQTKPATDPADKRFSTILGTLQRMTAAERLGLFQSPQFHGLLPAEARALLEPMRRDDKLTTGEDA